jgi:hypothetical protein
LAEELLKLRKLTKEDIINLESGLLSGEYEILGKYVNTPTSGVKPKA